MRKMVINVGNTNVAIGILDTDGKLKTYSLTHKYEHTGRHIDELIVSQVQSSKIEIDSIVISSVVPALSDYLSSALKRAMGIKPYTIDKKDITLDYTTYDSSLLGIDRLLVCQSALNKYKPPFIVFDMGTAITANVIDKDGKFVGGAIMPGIEMGLQALNVGTALLPSVDIMKESDFVIGNNTNKCLISGAIYGTASMVDGITKKIENELGYTCNVIMTGGGAKYIAPQCQIQVNHEHELLLYGLLSIELKKEVGNDN